MNVVTQIKTDLNSVTVWSCENNGFYFSNRLNLQSECNGSEGKGQSHRTYVNQITKRCFSRTVVQMKTVHLLIYHTVAIYIISSVLNLIDT